MTKEEINEYTMRISQANASKLAVICQELAIRYIREALTAYPEAEASGDYTDYESTLNLARGAIDELLKFVKTEEQTGRDLKSIYLYTNKQLMLSVAKRKPIELEESAARLEKIKASFEEIAARDYDPPLMENTQQVYAGLTYGKGYLNESTDPMGDANRGLQA